MSEPPVEPAGRNEVNGLVNGAHEQRTDDNNTMMKLPKCLNERRAIFASSCHDIENQLTSTLAPTAATALNINVYMRVYVGMLMKVLV